VQWRRNPRARGSRHIRNLSKEIHMYRLAVMEHVAFAALGTLAAACTLALAVLGPLAA
jgi:hypothetical protein